MVQYNQKYVRGAPGVNERLLALDSGLRSRRFSCVTTGFRSNHTSGLNLGGAWRCIRQGSAPWVAGDTWKTYGSLVTGADTTGWRYGKLPFPSTLCVSLLFNGMTADGTNKIQLMAKGLDQFGRPMTETTPLISLHKSTGALLSLPTVPAPFQTARIFMSRVFSEVETISYRVYGTAPVPPGAGDPFEFNVGQHFTFNSLLATSIVGAAPGSEHFESFYFPANQGIGVGTLLAQERGTAASRYPEIRVTAWDGQAGPDHMVQLLPHTTGGAQNGGIYMGFTDRTHWLFHVGLTADQDFMDAAAVGSARYSQFDTEPLKFRIEHSPASSLGTNALIQNNITSMDAGNFLFYTPVTVGEEKFNNPKTIHWSVEAFTQLGALSPRMYTSDRVNS